MQRYYNVSKLIQKKTNHFFKFAVGLFIITLVLLSSGISFIVKQYSSWDENFISNTNTHFITVSRRTNGDILKFGDYENIRKECENSKIKCEVVAEYSLECGVGTKKYGDIFISSLTGLQDKLLRVKNYNQQSCYSNYIECDNLMANIPIVSVENGNFTADRKFEFAFRKIRAIGENPVVKFYDELENGELYIPQNEFIQIVEKMFETKWDVLKKKYDDNNPYSLNLIKNYYVYVNDIQMINQCAKKLKNSGFSVNYTLKAFDNIGKNTVVMYCLIIVFMIILFVVAYFIMLIAMKSYYETQSHDIGILKQLGYSKKVLYHIYLNIMKKPILCIGGVAFLYTWLLLSILCIKFSFRLMIEAIILFIIAVLWISIKVIVNKIVSRNLLILLKNKV